MNSLINNLIEFIIQWGLNVNYILIKNLIPSEINTKYQYILEKPSNFKFDPTYLNLVTYNANPLIQCLDNYCKLNSIYSNGAIVSLSGGVDSMVILAILIHLQTIYKFPIYTASIDYGLRIESNDETNFLMEYTKMFGIKCYIVKIHGVSRKKEDSKSRSEFEEESRNLRFNTYKKIIEENNLNSDCGVFVGHHQDDIIENIFTNSMRGGNLLDLEVMKSDNKINGVNIYRPFLNFRKNIIYDFAHKFNVPYFLDTTPKWSRRGKMRMEIFPLLDSVFGINWRNKLKLIGDQSNEWDTYLSKYVIEPWLKEVKFGSCGFIIPIKSQPKIIYSNIILKSLHKLGYNMIRKTSIDKIMLMIENKTNKVINLDGSRYATLIKNNEYIIIFNTKFYSQIGINKYDDIIDDICSIRNDICSIRNDILL